MVEDSILIKSSFGEVLRANVGRRCCLLSGGRRFSAIFERGRRRMA
jgi:hypothetical protein